jgi:energy-coupling factor transporter ATP-binding protein EcfA2
VLSLRGVSYRYPGAALDSLHDISLELPGGSITGLLGAPGSGLSTLCLVLGGLAPRVIGGTLRGESSIDGQDVRDWPMHRLCESVVSGLGQPAGQLSMVAATVYEEVAFGPANLGLPRGEVMARTEQALEQLAIHDLASRDPGRLSGGQQQLVALAGLLAMRARHLVLDEPMAQLDARGRELALAALAAAAAGGAAVLVATQHSDIVAEVCSSVALLAGGRIMRQGPPGEVLADPATWALGIAEPAEQRLARLLGGIGDGH